jgi:hypothetical protein
LAAIPLGAIHTFFKAKGENLKEKFFFSIKPTIADLEEKPDVFTIKPDKVYSEK